MQNLGAAAMSSRSDGRLLLGREMVAKAQPGKLSFGSAGVGNVMHFAAEMFNSMAGTRTTHIPYKGVAQVLPDGIGGRIDFTFGPPVTPLPHVKSEKLRALGITAKTRWNELPEVPTIDEQGVKGYVYLVWYGFWFPGGHSESVRQPHAQRNGEGLGGSRNQALLCGAGLRSRGRDACGVRKDHRRGHRGQFK
jgi:hypothetical protein